MALFCFSLTASSIWNVLDPTRWSLGSGADISDKCGNLRDGNSVVFSENGQRELVTRDLDLTITRYFPLFYLSKYQKVEMHWFVFINRLR